MSKRVIGCDIDGVLANWNQAMADVLVAQTGRNLIPADWACQPPVWNWLKHYGYTPEECTACYAATAADELFWATLENLSETTQFLDALQAAAYTGVAEDDDIYFITTRPGVNAKAQTEAWLELNGVQNPTVILALNPDKKAAAAFAVGLTHFIDDKGENCLKVKQACPEAQVFLLNAGWNRAEQKDLRAAGIVVVDSILQFTEALNA